MENREIDRDREGGREIEGRIDKRVEKSNEIGIEDRGIFGFSRRIYDGCF